jgi:hypothetical protein
MREFVIAAGQRLERKSLGEPKTAAVVTFLTCVSARCGEVNAGQFYGPHSTSAAQPARPTAEAAGPVKANSALKAHSSGGSSKPMPKEIGVDQASAQAAQNERPRFAAEIRTMPRAEFDKLPLYSR